MEFQDKLFKYIKNKELIKDCNTVAQNFIITPEYEGKWSNYHEFSLDFDYDSDTEFISWINFVWEYKHQELENFIHNIKYGEFAIFENIGCPENLPYYDDCPHKIIAYPSGDKYRFIVVACEDYDNDEYILTDILVQQNALIDNLEKSFLFMKKKIYKNKKLNVINFLSKSFKQIIWLL